MSSKAPLILKSRPDAWLKTHWNPDPIMEEFFEKGVDIRCPNVRHLVAELDRRLSQLTHKIQFEK